MNRFALAVLIHLARLRERVADRRRDRVRDVLDGTAVTDVVTALVAVGAWWSLAADGALDGARTRDAVRAVGEQQLVGLNSLDAAQAEPDMDRWLAATTADLHDELTRNRAQYVATVRQARSVTTARVVDSAVTQLDPDAGTARMIAVVDLTITLDGSTPFPRRSRIDAALLRTDVGWNLADAEVVGARA